MLKYMSMKFLLSLQVAAFLALAISCDNDDKDDAGAQVVLKSFGPAVLRGGELKFIGVNLNRVTAIVLPESVEIPARSEEHTSELQSRRDLVCRLLLEKKKKKKKKENNKKNKKNR